MAKTNPANSSNPANQATMADANKTVTNSIVKQGLKRLNQINTKEIEKRSPETAKRTLNVANILK